jgi:tetratricopeptide (TPR) repeat protein
MRGSGTPYLELLGPVRAWSNGQEIHLGSPLERGILAVLALRREAAVSRGWLVDAVWGERHPASAVNSVHIYVSRLRSKLEPDRVRREPGKLLVTAGSGYVLRLGAGSVDVEVFGSEAERARERRAAGDLEGALAALDAALGLWRGTPLDGIPGPFATAERGRLEELRVSAAQQRAEVMLALGRHADAVPQLRALVSDYPLREELRALLMLTLFRSGRQAEALTEYADARKVLVEELGIEPGAELRRTHDQVLAGDAAAQPPQDRQAAAPQAAAPRQAPVPRQMPPPVPMFTGRRAETKRLTGMLPDSFPAEGGPLPVALISGMPGVGKTALAVHWAHHAASRFPDGQLYVNLRGYDPGEPMAAADALAAFLRALDVPGQDIPMEADERAAQYRSLLAGRRMLVLLDNAGSVEQVRPLLPAPDCMAIVTSRDTLTGLVARDGAFRLDLDLLPPDDAIGLLRALIGDRVDADPAAGLALVAQCCRLPLALRLAAELAAAQPDVPLADLVAELTDQQRRLDLLDADGDPRTAVRAVFSWSYRYLDTDAARTFRLCALHPGPDFERCAVAALTATSADQAGRTLATLARAHLMQAGQPGRYSMHDLLRGYGRELAGQRDGAAETHQALTRLFDSYLHTAMTADRPWLDAQRENLVTAVVHAAGNGWPGHAIRLAECIHDYLQASGHFPEACVVHEHARRAGHDTGDRAAEATALVNLGVSDLRQGRYEQALGYYQPALALFRELNDRPGQARALNSMGLVEWRTGHHQQATERFQQSLDLYREAGDRDGEARVLGNLGAVGWRLGRYQEAAAHFNQCLGLCREIGAKEQEAQVLKRLGLADMRLGRYQQATEYFQRALEICREQADRSGEIEALLRLGEVESRLGQHQQAWDDLRQVLKLCRESGERSDEAEVLYKLGGVLLGLGRHQEAIDNHETALEMCREVGERFGETEVLNGLGEALLAAGRPDEARARYAAALTLASQIGDRYEQARAYDGLGQACQAAGQPGQARGHWQEALARYASLGVPEADRVRARLGPDATS